MDPPASPHPFQPGVHHHEQIQRVVSPGNQTGLAHYQNQYASYEQYHRNDTEVAQHDTRQQVFSRSDKNILICRYPKIGQFDDNQCRIQLQIREECIDTKKSKDRRTEITSADLGSDKFSSPLAFTKVHLSVYNYSSAKLAQDIPIGKEMVVRMNYRKQV